jgi:hypothetical protein
MLAAVVRALDEWGRSATRVVFGVGVWGLECVGFVVRCCCGGVHGLGVGRVVVSCGSALRVWSVLCGTGGGREVTLCSPGKFSRPRVVFTTANTSTALSRLPSPHHNATTALHCAAQYKCTQIHPCSRQPGDRMHRRRVARVRRNGHARGLRMPVGRWSRAAGRGLPGLRRRTREAGARRVAPSEAVLSARSCCVLHVLDRYG